MRIAVLGCGSIGKRHTRSLMELGYNDLLFYDPSPAARQTVAEEFHRHCSDTLEDVFTEQPDVVLVNSPSNSHLELAQAAVAQGCHLFIEKPLADRSNDIEPLIHEAKRKGLVCMVACNMRFHPGPAKVKALLEEEIVGQILYARLMAGSYLPSWRPWMDYRESVSARRELGGGAILECLHEIDLARWYLGDGRLVAAVTRKADVLGLEVEGVAEVLVKHSGGAISSIHLNFVQRDYHRGCILVGEKGTIYWKFQNPWIEVHDGSQIQRIELDLQRQPDKMYVDEMAYFLRHVEARQETFSTLTDGLAALNIALAARFKAENSVLHLDRHRKLTKTVAIIQARMGSSRLPGKVMADIEGRPMLGRVVDRARRARLTNQTVVITSQQACDDPIESFCAANDIPCFRGSEEDVLDRYYRAAIYFQADVIVRLTADCPLIDPEIIDETIMAFQNNAFDYVSNSLHRSYPDGLDTEVFWFATLARAWSEARWKSEREHVTAYVLKHPELFQLGNVASPVDYSNLRWTVDQPQDLELIRAVYRKAGDGSLGLAQVLSLIQNNPELQDMNSGIIANEGYYRSLAQDELIQPREELPL
ncbi:MAG: Gfo/Idh/MocA family oxidoreductase [Acidobacteria bacterium]|nr:Gfo/Idh/MocA family oxidoreductase [Acidobacteriota bacterium]